LGDAAPARYGVPPSLTRPAVAAGVRRRWSRTSSCAGDP